MPANTYVALATQTIGTATNSITFTGIPQGYTDLVLVTSVGSNNPVEIMVFQVGNGSVDTGSNYSTTYLLGNGSTASSGRFSNLTYGALDRNLGVTTTTGGLNTITHFMNYSNTTTNKTILSRANQVDATYNGAEAMVNLWRSTAAINTIKVFITNGVLFNVGSTFSLYGVAAASVGAKATGGTIYQDASYFYHVFAGNGTFTPLQSLSADVLCVGGGGSGGGQYGGGGGAGGVVYDGSRSLTATGYTVTIGAGGTAISSSAANGNNGVNTSFDTLVANGGGGGGSWNGTGGNGLTGGSGGGGSMGTAAGNTTSGGAANQGVSTGDIGYGFAGGGGIRTASVFYGGGGGGAGAVGQTATGSSVANGGDGTNAYSSWLAVTGFGVNGYIAGGGGGTNGSSATPKPLGGAGGGGNGGIWDGTNPNARGDNGVANTGGGGGGYAANATSTSGAGGSGVVIVRYAKA